MVQIEVHILKISRTLIEHTCIEPKDTRATILNCRNAQPWIKNTALADENIELKDGNTKISLQNKALQDEVATLKTDKVRLAFHLNEVESVNTQLECEKEQEKKKATKQIESLTSEKNSLMEKVAEMEETISKELQQPKENDEKLESVTLEHNDHEL